MLKARILTAVILLPLVLVVLLFLPPIVFLTIFSLLMVLGAWEWASLVGLSTWWSRALYVLLVVACIVGVYLLDANLNSLVPSLLVWCWMLVAILFYQFSKKAMGLGSAVVRGLMGCVLLASCWEIALILTLHYSVLNEYGLLLLLLIVWSADTGAYFAGKWFGKRQLASQVSPNKTWAGFAGGLLLSVVVGLFINMDLQVISGLGASLLVILGTALAAVLGDLGVSLLKRIAVVKDTGQFFPGHGGVLDRLDSFLCASVFFIFLIAVF